MRNVRYFITKKLYVIKKKLILKALKAMGPESFKVIVHSIIWAFKHTMRNISEIGLEITLQLLGK
mgnify:CR=1 FL=1